MNNQIDPILNEKSTMDEWFHLLVSEKSIHRLSKRLFSGQPSYLIENLCSDTKMKESKDNHTLLKAISYLLSVEVQGNFIIDVFILMMAGKGYDFHIEPDNSKKFVRHATSLDDFESASITLASKLDFLKSCGLPCFEKYIDRKLRNKIAHMNFVINEEGKFFMFDNNKKKTVMVEQKLGMLQYFTNQIYKRLNDKIEEHNKFNVK
jgi:hypothetical protein